MAKQTHFGTVKLEYNKPQRDNYMSFWDLSQDLTDETLEKIFMMEYNSDETTKVSHYCLIRLEERESKLIDILIDL